MHGTLSTSIRFYTGNQFLQFVFVFLKLVISLFRGSEKNVTQYKPATKNLLR